MKRCLDNNELLRLWTAEAGDFPDHRAHLGECPQCTASYGQLTLDAGAITVALTDAADHLRSRKSTAIRSFQVRGGNGWRTAAIFCGATAFGGAGAFALMIALGWQPISASTRPENSSAHAVVAKTITDDQIASASAASAMGESGISPSTTRSLYAVDADTSDPLAGLTSGDSNSAGNLNPAEDLLFCVPGDDGAICSSSDEQG